MLIAITGGMGFIGRALVDLHIMNGDQIRILSPVRPELSLHDSITLYLGDLVTSVDVLDRFVDGADILYHCAAEILDEDKMYPVNVTGTRNLCKAASGRIGHWVQLSSVGVYGRQVSGVVTEETELNPKGMYEVTKAESDSIVTSVSREDAFSCSILRPSNVYGTDMRNQSLFQMVAVIEKGLFFFIGQPGASANYIHVDNVAEALMLCGCSQASRGGVFNISDRLALEAFVAVIADELGRRTPTLRLPERPVRWVTRALDPTKRFPLTESRIDAMTTRSIYSIDKIRDELAYDHRVTIEDGIRQLVRKWK